MTTNRPWHLNTFLDALIYELDRAQDTLSVKGANRKLTYMVKDMSLDLQLFPEFDGENVHFTTAKPGETGASKITFQLGSIRDHQIQEIAKDPLSHDDISIDEIDLPKEANKTLKKLGIYSTKDLQRTIEEKGIDLDAHTGETLDREHLSHILDRERRRQNSPVVSHARFFRQNGRSILRLEGQNLMIYPENREFPVAVLDGVKVPIQTASETQLQLLIDRDRLKTQPGKLEVALDRYAIITLTLKT
ncbi:hypothetical protein [Baaleninema simplex]|uniref:hypothetical protein n=1 Tax=Baaleninema simplex TaxID=2862350 RepID=UPI00034616F8|nr:hypothetical protein [Baaleninema simplex]